MALRYDPPYRDILSEDNIIVATVSGISHREDPTLGHTLAAALEMRKALIEARNTIVILQNMANPGRTDRATISRILKTIDDAMLKAKP